MTTRRQSQPSLPMCALRVLALGAFFAGWAPGSRASPPPVAGSSSTVPLSKSVAAALQRDSARCRRNADVDACYDALRRRPDDAALLAALGDALMRAQRPADALRNYRRAAALVPNLRGIAAKISAAESRPRPRRNLSETNVSERYSNMAPPTQSH